ncbi:hypothetical protein BJ970_001196 [Saccharopolyspora phatthalungensis]|uniref:Uncharacterized protein n=1 Tax=Saccharopolyspora phatthalungensis TaxID=664693 RepID=A0A840PTP1_9PSEU|nr:hypothetical protein [Saccharopolyspora phatthalungensis]
MAAERYDGKGEPDRQYRPAELAGPWHPGSLREVILSGFIR